VITTYEVPFIVNGMNYYVDIHLSALHVAVEIDGRMHWSRWNKSTDRPKDDAGIGEKVIRMEIADAAIYRHTIPKEE
jgi:very-short-patch-repair endonuclease